MEASEEVNLPGWVKGIVLIIPTILVLVLCEWLAEGYLKNKFGEDFDLAVQGTGEMAPSDYQLWEHPANYWNWLKLSRYNNLGFRRFEDTSVQKEPGTTRIFFMGGSGALGSAANPGYPWLRMSGQAQYSANETITYYLEEHLNEKYPDQQFEVINAATNWAQLHQQLIHYYRKIRYLEPDLVISMDGQNDASSIHGEYLSFWDQARYEKVPLIYGNFRTQMRPFITRSHLLFLLAAQIFGQTTSGKLPIDQPLVDQYKALSKPADYEAGLLTYQEESRELLDEGVNFYLDHLQHFNDALNRDGVKALFVQQPQLVMDRTKPLTDIETAMQNYMFAETHPYAASFFAFVERGGERLAADEDLPFYSFLNIFGDAEGEVYVDYTHLTPDGNKLLARTLAEVIEAEHPSLFRK